MMLPRFNRPIQRFVYWITTVVVRISAALFNDLRCDGIGNWPAKGGGLVCANHQSYLDPILIGSICPRQMNYLARESLFRWPPFARILRMYNSIPLQREGLGIGGLKTSLKQLRAGGLLLIFPEGTRTHDGALQPIHGGFCTLARRGNVPIIPVGIDGPFTMWSRHQRFPRLAGVRVRFVVGEPLSVAEIADLTDEQLIAEVHSRMQSCLARTREMPPLARQ